jgi:hypothetical protein
LRPHRRCSWGDWAKDIVDETSIAPCDPEYIEALGHAVYNFAWLEYNVVWVVELLEPSYWGEYVSKAKSAGDVAKDLERAIHDRAKGHVAEAELRDISKTFSDLKVRRNKLLHATPIVASDGRRLHHLAQDIAWGVDKVRQASTDFAAAAESAQAVFRKLCTHPVRHGCDILRLSH